jgi:plasmid stability protein
MTELVIKNLPADVLTRLKHRAKANRRSLTKEVIVLLERSVEAAPTAPAQAAPMTTAVELPDGMEALRAALIKQPDGSYINLLGVDDAGFFETLDKLRGEFQLPEPIDFGGGKT